MARFTTGTYIAGLVGAAAILAACGGGGSSAPAAPKAPAAMLGTAAPSAANRTAVAHATLSLALPRIAHARSSAAALRARTSSGSHTQFIDPSPNPNPTAGSEAGNVLDIYVDGTLQPNLDSGTSGHSVVVTPTIDGAQSLTLPIYSTSTNTIVAIEYDPTGSQVLALGETDTGNFAPGTTQQLGLTMSMNATGIGIVDLPNQNSVQMLSPQGPPTYQTPCSPSSLAFFPTDALNNLLTVTGSGTGTGVTLQSSSSTGGGTSHLSTNSLGQYVAVFDAVPNAIDVNVSVQNPAYNIFADINNNNDGYSNHHYYPDQYSNPGPNQGIWDLSFTLGLSNQISQTSTQTLNQEEVLTAPGC